MSDADDAFTDIRTAWGLNADGTAPDLHVDLVPYVGERDGGLMVLSHPLVVIAPYTPILNGHANTCYAHKLRVLDEYRDDEDWLGYVWAHERPYRVDAFIEIEQELEDHFYWRLLRLVWIDSENIHQCIDEWRELLTADREDKRLLMEEEELAALEALPDPIPVFRGTDHPSDGGLSWTVDRERALWFATRYGRTGHVLKGRVRKADVIAYFTVRNEAEIVSMEVER